MLGFIWVYRIGDRFNGGWFHVADCHLKFWQALIAAVVISVLGFGVESLFGNSSRTGVWWDCCFRDRDLCRPIHSAWNECQYPRSGTGGYSNRHH